MQNPILRIIQRYMLPNFIVSCYHLVKSRAIVSPRAIVQFSPRISFGEGTVVKPYAIIATHKGRVVIGENCAISSFNHIAARDSDVVIGNHVRTGPGAVIHGTRRKYKRADMRVIDQGHTDRGITVGDDVLIGAHAILFECRIGRGAIIGAGSIVTRDVPENAIVVGAPSRVVGYRTESDEALQSHEPTPKPMGPRPGDPSAES